MTTPAEPISSAGAPSPETPAPVQPQAGKPASAAVQKPLPEGVQPHGGKPASPEPKPSGDGDKPGASPEEGKDKPKGDEPPASEPSTPETYTFQMPEGVQLDEKLVESVTPVLKEGKVSQETAQKLMDIHVAQLKAAQEQGQAAIKAMQEEQERNFKATVENWKQDSVKALGADSEAQLALAAKAKDRLFSKETQELLDATGLGNNISLIRDFIRIGKSISEGTLVSGASAPATGGATAASMYPSMSKNQ